MLEAQSTFSGSGGSHNTCMRDLDSVSTSETRVSDIERPSQAQAGLENASGMSRFTFSLAYECGMGQVQG
jgi:hypothetical protein